MAEDARIAVGLPTHPKTKKLIKRLGQSAAWNLVCLFLWAATNRSDGALTGMSVEDIELAADWTGEDGAFVSALIDVRFIDDEEGTLVLHDWHQHNPWAAGSDMRSAKARWNAAKRHHGVDEADRLVPEYAAIRNASSNASSTNAAQDQQLPSNAPSPSPSPSPSPIVEEAADKPATRKTGSRLPDEWQLPKSWGEWALEKYPHFTVEIIRDEATKFANHWHSTTGKAATKLDWYATWQNWIMSDICQRSHQPSKPNPFVVAGVTVPSNDAERTAQMLREQDEARRLSQEAWAKRKASLQAKEAQA